MNDVLLNKAVTIENCLKRIAEEYVGHENELATNFTKQDAIVLNLQRACEAVIDMGMHVIRVRRFTVPQTLRDVFVILEEKAIIAPQLSKNLQAMIGFRNIAVHDYSALNLVIIEAILKKHLQDFVEFKKIILQLQD